MTKQHRTRPGGLPTVKTLADLKQWMKGWRVGPATSFISIFSKQRRVIARMESNRRDRESAIMPLPSGTPMHPQ